MALLVDNDDPVGSAGERDAEIGAHFPHLSAKCVGSGRTAFTIDVETVGLHADGDDIGTEFPQGFGSDAVSRTIGAVNDNAEALKREVARQGPLGEFNVAIVYAVNPLGPA